MKKTMFISVILSVLDLEIVARCCLCCGGDIIKISHKPSVTITMATKFVEILLQQMFWRWVS